MNNRNVKVIDEHNIDRNANIMFAVDLKGSEYVVYWIERDETSNNVFVSKILRNLDGTYNMLNIDDDDKKREVSEIVKFLISASVSDQNDKLIGVTKTLVDGEVAKFIAVSFNKEQNINVPKTYITTVKKEVTKVVEDYYDVVSSENEIKTVLTPVTNATMPVASVETPGVTPVEVLPVVEETITNVVPPVVEIPAETMLPEINSTQVVVSPVVEENVDSVVVAPVVEPIVTKVEPLLVTPVETPVIEVPKVETPVVNVVTQPVSMVSTPEVIQEPVAAVSTVQAVPVNPEPVMVAPVTQPTVTVQAVPEVPAFNVETSQINDVKPEVVVPVTPTPVVTENIVTNANVSNDQTLVFNAAKETNLNAALGEVANSSTIPVQNINVVREFGEEAPVLQNVTQPVIAPMVQPNTGSDPKVLVKKAGFANSKFFMVVAIAFFMASCVFLGYEVYNYFQITK